MSDEVDLVVVRDHKLPEQIIKALKHAGIHHVEFWPEDISWMDLHIGRLSAMTAPPKETRGPCISACEPRTSTRRTWSC